MFAKATLQPGEKYYQYDISKYYKIWFSPNPDVFLGIENQLRFVRMRHNNPKADLFFIYSQTCLSTEAKIALDNFCTQYSIIPIAFEDIECELVEDMDKTLYFLAQEEINHNLINAGGNMAAASDIVRMLVYVIQKYGIYSDFDVDTRLAEFNSQYISLRGPLLLNAELLTTNSTQLMLIPNTDFLAFSLDSSNQKNISKDALLAIHNVQAHIIDNYKLPFAWEKLALHTSLKEFAAYPELPELIAEFHQKYSVNPSIFDFRLYLSSLPEGLAKQGQMKPVKSLLTHFSVINISGPGVFSSLFKTLIPSQYVHMPLKISYNEKQWLPYLNLYERCSLGFYDPIYDRVDTKNRLRSALSAKNNERPCDKSWTVEGMTELKNREIQIINASTVLQRSYRRHTLWQNYPEESLLLKIKNICSQESSISPKIDKNHSSLLSALIDKNYALVLRRACSGLKLSIVRLLLEYRENGRIAFELNEHSVSSGFTALNLALEAKPTKKTGIAIQQAIVQLLRNAGALEAKEICSLNSGLTKNTSNTL